MNNIIKITPSALNVLKDIYIKSNNKYLSFGIKSGGCSGFQYLIKPCISKLDANSLLRVKANLNPRTVFHRNGGFHFDYPNVTTSIFYINSKSSSRNTRQSEEIS